MSVTPLAVHGDRSVVVSARKVVTLEAASSILPGHPNRTGMMVLMPRKVRDLEAERLASQRHYAANPEYYRDRNRRTKIRKREYVREVRSQPCTDCRESFPWYVMEFDHVPGRGEKLFNLGNPVSYGMNQIKNEIAKCDVVCANCHRERTYRRRLCGGKADTLE